MEEVKITNSILTLELEYKTRKFYVFATLISLTIYEDKVIIYKTSNLNNTDDVTKLIFDEIKGYVDGI